MANDYDYTKHTPVDNTGTAYSVFKSGYKNLRFSLPVSQNYTITEPDMANLVGLAARFFGDTSFWYPILSFNGIQDPIQEVYPGTILKLPSKNDLIEALSKQQNTQLPVFKI